MNLLNIVEFVASPTESLQRQSCVATILTSSCKTMAEQNNLCQIGGPLVLGKLFVNNFLVTLNVAQFLASLLSVDHPSVRIPVAMCLASMCFNNPNVAKEIVNTSYRDVKIIGYLSMMISRDKPIEMQLEAAR